MTALAEERLESVRRRHPETVVLARRLSLAARAEPALVRAARLSARLDAMTESDLWFSGLVASAGPLGLALDPAVADLLRAELDADEREVAWQLVDAHHGREPWSIRLEERINYLAAGADDSGEIDELLAAALDELHDTDQRAALGIARWLLAALARLPATAGTSQAAAAARVVAGARLDGRIGELDALSPEQRETWLPKLLGGLGAVDLPVRLLMDAVVLGGDPVGAVSVPVPKTDPIAVTVDDVEVRLRVGEERRVTIRGREAHIRTIAGDLTTLSPVAVGRLTHNGVDVAPACAIAERTVVTVADELPSRVLFVPATAPSAPSGASRKEGEVIYLDVYESFTPAPLTTVAVGDRWRFADGRPGTGIVALLGPSEILVGVEGQPDIERGVALMTERPWGAVFGLALGRNQQGFLRVAPLKPTSPSARPAEEIKLAELGIPPHPLLGEAHIPRTVDRHLDQALAAGWANVTGPEHPGKARTLWEAVRRTGRPVAIGTLLAGPSAIIWLDHPETELTNGLPGDVTVAMVLGNVEAGIRIEPTLTPEELDEAWRLFGPELALDPEEPWSDDELAARERAVARARTERDSDRLARALWGYGRELRQLGREDESLKAFAESGGMARDSSLLLGLAKEYAIVDSERAIELAKRAAEAAERPGERRDALIIVSEYLTVAKRLDEARSAAEAAVDAARAADDPAELARALGQLAEVYVLLNDERGIDTAAEVLRLRREGGGVELVRALEALASALERLGRVAGAVEPTREAAALAEQLGETELVAALRVRMERLLPRRQPPETWNEGEIQLFHDRLLTPQGTVARDDIANVQIVSGSWRKLPRARIERRDGSVLEFAIRDSATINFPANNRAAEAFLAAVKRQ